MITRGLLGPFLAGTQVSNPVRSAQRRFCLGRFIWFSRCTGGGFFGCLKLIFRAIHTHIEALQWSVGLKNAPIHRCFFPPLYASTLKSSVSPLGLRNGGKNQKPHHLQKISPHFTSIATYFPPIFHTMNFRNGGKKLNTMGGNFLQC